MRRCAMLPPASRPSPNASQSTAKPEPPYRITFGRCRKLQSMKPTLPILLSINGGYVDTAGYLALQGLFTSHVTGNFVTLGATLALGTGGAVPKLLALPV